MKLIRLRTATVAAFGVVCGTLGLVAAVPAHAATPSATVFSAPTHSATVIPRTGSGCNPNLLEAASECTTVVGGGLYITSISGVTFSNVLYEITRVHIQVYGPRGTIHNCGTFNLPALGEGPVCQWVNPTPHARMPAGNYCTKAWTQSGSAYVGLSAECVDVHN
jgi:hypothetical protein